VGVPANVNYGLGRRGCAAWMVAARVTLVGVAYHRPAAPEGSWEIFIA
jgi:hypothetical protein